MVQDQRGKADSRSLLYHKKLAGHRVLQCDAVLTEAEVSAFQALNRFSATT